MKKVRVSPREEPAVCLAYVQADPVLAEAAAAIESGLRQRQANHIGPTTSAMFLRDLGRFLVYHRATRPHLWKGRP